MAILYKCDFCGAAMHNQPERPTDIRAHYDQVVTVYVRREIGEPTDCCPACMAKAIRRAADELDAKLRRMGMT